MVNIIKADLYSLRKSKSINLMMLLSLIGAIIMAVVSYFVASGKLQSDVTGLTSLFTDIPFISLLSVIMAAIYICGDFKNKTIQDAIAFGYRHLSVIMAKTITYAILIGLMILPYLVVSMLGGLMNAPFSAYIPSTYMYLISNQTTIGARELIKIIAIYFSSVCIFLGQFSMCILLAFTLKNSAIVIGIGYGISFLSGQLLNISMSNETLGKILNYTPFGSDYTAMTLSSDYVLISKAIVVSFVFAVIMVFVTNLCFRKSELK